MGSEPFFDTVKIGVPDVTATVAAACAAGVNLRALDAKHVT